MECRMKFQIILVVFMVLISTNILINCAILKNNANNNVLGKKFISNKESDAIKAGDNLDDGRGNNYSFSETELSEDSRKKKGGEKESGDMMSKILPMMIIPFMVSTGMIPMMLMSLKFMLLQSVFVGKVAVILMLINMFRRRTDGGGVSSHNINERDVSLAHYGYGGDEEYGAYINRKKSYTSR